MTRFLHFLFYTVINGFSMSGGDFPLFVIPTCRNQTEKLCQQAGKAAACLENEDTRNGNTI